MLKYTDYTAVFTLRYNTFYLAYVVWLEQLRRNISVSRHRVTIDT